MLEGIDALVALHAFGTVSEAATRLRLTQSAVSKRIQSLQAAVGFRLVEPDGRRLRLTPRATELVERARPLVAELRGLTKPAAPDASSSFSLALADSVASSWGPEMVRRALRRLPGVSVELHAHRSVLVLESVKLGRYDIGLCTESATSTGLIGHPLTDEPMVLVHGRFAPQKGRRLPLITIEPTSATWRAIHPLLRAHHPDLLASEIVGVESFGAVVQMVKAGFGNGVVPLGLIREMKLDRAAYRALSGVARRVSLVTRKTVHGLPGFVALRDQLTIAAARYMVRSDRRMTRWAWLAAAGGIAACGPTVTDPAASGDASTGSATAGSGGAASGATGSGTTGSGGSPASSGAGGADPCPTLPDEDQDQDGFTAAEGDCNDCDPNIGPGAVEIIGSADPEGGIPPPTDEDCNGRIDDKPYQCDDRLEVDDPDPVHAAMAIGLCKQAAGPKDWGVVSAKWTRLDGSALGADASLHLGHGLLNTYGLHTFPQNGTHMLALSTGVARAPGHPEYVDVAVGLDKGLVGAYPDGYPAQSPDCPPVTPGPAHDDIALEVVVRTPSNVEGFSFDHDFFTTEWLDQVCTAFDDGFVALLFPPPPQGALAGNIAFDSKHDPIDVNTWFEICECAGGPPCTTPWKVYDCPSGAELSGTGFEGHASTGWLEAAAEAPKHAEITVRWAIWDAGDGARDSTVLLDNWRWVPHFVLPSDPLPE